MTTHSPLTVPGFFGKPHLVFEMVDFAKELHSLEAQSTHTRPDKHAGKIQKLKKLGISGDKLQKIMKSPFLRGHRINKALQKALNEKKFIDLLKSQYDAKNGNARIPLKKFHLSKRNLGRIVNILTDCSLIGSDEDKEKIRQTRRRQVYKIVRNPFRRGHRIKLLWQEVWTERQENLNAISSQTRVGSLPSTRKTPQDPALSKVKDIAVAIGSALGSFGSIFSR